MMQRDHRANVPRVAAVCKQCQQPFMAILQAVRAGRGTYCSYGCAMLARNAARREKFLAEHPLPTAPPGVLFVPLWQPGVFATIDAVDYGVVAPHVWTAVKCRNTTYAKCQPIRGKAIYMHRLLTGCITPDNEVDHIDGNGLNNRRYNLRVCSHRENIHNAGKHAAASSHYRGVCYLKARHAYRAQITADGQTHYIGQFSDEITAARAYDAAARLLYGSYARLNLPSEPFIALPSRFLARLPDNHEGT